MGIEEVADRILATILERADYTGVYASPWWQLPSDSEQLRGWKRAILRRRPAGGAEHWGHLFLIEGRIPPGWSLQEETSPAFPPSGGVREGYPVRGSSTDLLIQIRARSPGTSAGLSDLAQILVGELERTLGRPDSERGR